VARPARVTIEQALATLPLDPDQQATLAHRARKEIAKWRERTSAGYYAPAPRPRDRAKRLRATARAARGAAVAERRLADAVEALWPPDNVTALSLYGEAKDPPQRDVVTVEEAPPGQPSGNVFPDRARKRAVELEAFAKAAERAAERWARRPAKRGRAREEAARWLVWAIMREAWPAHALGLPEDRRGAGYAAESPFERFALAALREAGLSVSVRTVRAALEEFLVDVGADSHVRSNKTSLIRPREHADFVGSPECPEVRRHPRSTRRARRSAMMEGDTDA